MENKEIKTALSGEATAEQIAMWKNLYGDVFEVKVEDKVCYLHKPDRKTLSAASTLGQNDPMRYNEIVLENCWISGDPDMKTKDDYFFAVVEKLEVLIEFKQSEIKKL